MGENLREHNSELEYFKELWSTRQMSPVRHSPDIWDERAKEWINALRPSDGVETVRARGMRERVRITSEYLRSRGLLTERQSVIDIGCGPGLFVLEFAKTARYATGVDYSARFVDYGNAEVQKQGISNASFIRRDFFAMDVGAEDMLRKFDLVFSSITPATNGDGCLEKLMSMSRGWCYNASFVHAGDSLSEKVCRDVFNEEFSSRWDGRGFYALLNLLWLLGYYPETSYFDDVRDEIIEPSLKWAQRIASYCNRHDEDSVQKILRYLEKLGDVKRQSVFRYGSILWDVNKRDGR